MLCRNPPEDGLHVGGARRIDLRHTALTHEAAAGNPAVYVQLKAGHTQGAITERYIHAAQVLFPGAAAKGEERLFGSTGDEVGEEAAVDEVDEAAPAKALSPSPDRRHVE